MHHNVYRLRNVQSASTYTWQVINGKAGKPLEFGCDRLTKKQTALEITGVKSKGTICADQGYDTAAPSPLDLHLEEVHHLAFSK